MYNDKYQNRLEINLEKIFEKIKKNYNSNMLDMLKEKYKKHFLEIEEKMKKNKFNGIDSTQNPILLPFIKYVIKNSEVYIEKYSDFENMEDMRVESNLKFLENTIVWAKKNNLPVPDCNICIWINDRFPWELTKEELESYPFFVYAKPQDIDIPIFPEPTFICLQNQEKYTGKCYNWNEMKEIINNNKYTESKNFDKKENVIFFKGTPTTKKTFRLREDLEEYADDKKDIYDIKLDAWKDYMPIENFSKYKFLLNLPGHYHWSNRLKYLFLMNSFVINVNTYTKNLYPKYKDSIVETFADYCIKKKYYFDITYICYRTSKESEQKYHDKVKILQKKQFEKFVEKLEKIYNRVNNNITKYEKKIEKGKKYMNKLSLNRIYQYIYKAIIFISQLEKDK